MNSTLTVKPIIPRNVKFYLIVPLFLLLCCCGTHEKTIDENYAATVVKNTLAISGDVTAKKLTGGLSGAKLFTVTSGSTKYVARFINNQPLAERKKEITALNIAATGGYGTKIYYANAEQAVIIMEFLPDQNISLQ